MGATATLNVRLPEELKKHGGQVLDRHGLSVSDAVRGLYEYLQDNQCLPAFLEKAEGESLYERRRKLARSMVGIVSVPKGFENAVVAASAQRHKVDIVVTRDEKSFKNSPIASMTPFDFMRHFKPANVDYDEIEL